MFALDVGQHQRTRDPVQHVGRRRAAAALLQPGVPGGADIGALGHLLAAQTRRAPAPRRETERRRIEPDAAIPQIGAERIDGLDAHADPVGHYTLIRSLL